MSQGRSTWAELGSLLGLSAPAAAERVRKLEEGGVIKGYAALIDAEAVGCAMTALISLSVEDAKQLKPLLQKIAALTQIQECHHVAGDVDYLLKVRCSGTRELERIVSEELKAFPGVKTRTMVVLSTIKETASLPLGEDEG